ncbi:MAG: DUF1028 domain-containing protein [Thermoguttaceae bacterium]
MVTRIASGILTCLFLAGFAGAEKASPANPSPAETSAGRSSKPAARSSPDPVAHYPLDKDASDALGRHPGTNHGATPAAGLIGGAMAFDGKKSYVALPVEATTGLRQAFCTQHWHEPKWGERALDLLAAGKLPEEVLDELLHGDENCDKRQLAIIDMQGRAANRNPAKADPDGIYWGAMSGRFYACQGNTLKGREVITAMSQAYEETRGSVADRLIAALVAGDRAGGDHRGRLAAGIRVAKRGVKGYWLELQVDQSDDAVTELAKKYAALKYAAKGPTNPK